MRFEIEVEIFRLKSRSRVWGEIKVEIEIEVEIVVELVSEIEIEPQNEMEVGECGFKTRFLRLRLRLILIFR